jgi:rhodanese-related sulfurtransferase
MVVPHEPRCRNAGAYLGQAVKGTEEWKFFAGELRHLFASTISRFSSRGAAKGQEGNLVRGHAPDEFLGNLPQTVCRLAGPRRTEDELKPLGQIGRWMYELLDKDEDIVIHCHHGMRSDRACQMLAANGFTNLKNLLGGIDEWSLKIDPSIPRY